MRALIFRVLFVAFVLASIAAARNSGAGEAYPYRWVFAFGKNLNDDASLKTIEEWADTSAAHGLNGMVLGADLDGILSWDAAALERLKKLKQHCDDKKIELIPLVLSAGYGSGVIQQDPNLCEGLPAKDVLFTVKGGEANVTPDTPVSAADGTFENHKGDELKCFDFQDGPGKCTFIDTTVTHDGKSSLRMENFADNKNRVRLIKELPIPNRHYVVRLYAKAAGLKGTLSACIYDGEEQISRLNFHLKDGADWQKIEFSVNSLVDKEMKVYIGAWDVKEGKIWVSGVEIFEPGLVNVLRRPGAPLTVKRDGTGDVFEEGADFEKVVDKDMAVTHAWHKPPAIKLTANSKIKEGDKLRVSYYTSGAPMLDKRQPVICMSEPKTFEVWKGIVVRVNEILHPKVWMLDMDEIRGGGTCALCANRKNTDGSKMTPPQILGACVSNQVQMIRDLNPTAEVAIWNDMFDPKANAQKHYYTVPGGYEGSWNYLPPKMIVVAWLLDLADESIAHFSKLGHRIVGGAYYDADDLEGCKVWLKALAKSPSSAGIMYTTWEVKFALLAAFGDLVSKP